MSRGTAIAAAAVVVLHAAPALADGGHSHAGKPGATADASERIIVSARETEDGHMLFEPSEIQVAKGTTVEIVLENAGEIEHELYLGTQEEIEKHAEQMLQFPEMEHDEPNAVRVDPGYQDAIYWEFTKEGTFTFACLMPGHVQLGMVGKVTVVDTTDVGMLQQSR